MHNALHLYRLDADCNASSCGRHGEKRLVLAELSRLHSLLAEGDGQGAQQHSLEARRILQDLWPCNIESRAAVTPSAS